ncbi:MAG TPA: hypothetical protein P5040_05985 [Smithella sp.]|nr:hypothetical protein [Smithella sp.]
MASAVMTAKEITPIHIRTIALSPPLRIISLAKESRNGWGAPIQGGVIFA